MPAEGTREPVRLETLTWNLENQPTSLFYKDEGGKSNFLTASCVISAKSSKTFPIGNLKLSPRLVYESGGEIEDEEEIFNVLSVDPKTLTSTNETFTVNFRIEKVSRRKDGKRFRVRFDVNKESSQVLEYISLDNMVELKTQAITVLSKRKNHSSHLIKEESTRPRRRRTSTIKIKKEVSVPLDFIRQLTEKVDNLENQVISLKDQVDKLEKKNVMASPLTRGLIPTSQGVFARGQRVHSLMFDQFEELNNTAQKAIKRSPSSTTELFELLSGAPQLLN